MDFTSSAAELSTDSLDERITEARQIEQECTASSTTASNVLMNVRMVSGMMGEMLQGIGAVKDRVAESQERALRATIETQAAIDRVAELAQVVEQIASTAVLVNRIAHETHMLALNATIEAARAGTAGRGFAVVASEVKVLSNQTAQATEDVNKHLASIRRANKGVMGSVAAVNENLGVIQNLRGEWRPR